MPTFSFSLVYAFQKQVQSILEVYFITKFLMDSKYTWNIVLQKVANFESQKFPKYTWSIHYVLFRMQKYIWSIA